MDVTYRCYTTCPINPFMNLIFCQHDVLFMENLVILSWVTNLITLIALLLKKNNKKSSKKQFPWRGIWLHSYLECIFTYLKFFIFKFLSAWSTTLFVGQHLWFLREEGGSDQLNIGTFTSHTQKCLTCRLFVHNKTVFKNTLRIIQLFCISFQHKTKLLSKVLSAKLAVLLFIH